VVRKANHLLDAECLAAAAAHDDWLPSLKMIAAYLRQEREAAAAAAQQRPRPPTAGTPPEQARAGRW
jgi:hypothetical protein